MAEAKHFNTPGFRSLTQAGIHLTEGESLPAGQGAIRSQQVTAPVDDPSWPPMPTLSDQHSQDKIAAEKAANRGRVLQVQPREPGKRNRHPEGVSGEELLDFPPQGVFLGNLPPVQFTCPCCSVVLTITDPLGYKGQPGPCPNCNSVITPPQLVSPFSLATHEEARDQVRQLKHYNSASLS